MFHKVPTGVWAIALLGLALSACTSGGFSPGATAFCSPASVSDQRRTRPQNT